MAFDGYFINKLIKELKPHLLNKRIDRIYANNDKLVFKLGKSFLNYTLSQNMGLFYMTFSNKVVGDNDFSLFLKKQILNYKLTAINQQRMDRIVYFEFEGVDLILGPVKKTLILESFGRNFNLILTMDNTIINAFRLVHDLEGKTILPNIEYQLLSSNQIPLEQSQIKGLTAKEISIKYEGISPLLASYLINNTSDINTFEINPTKCLTNNQFYWFNLFDTKNIMTYDSLSELLLNVTPSKKDPKLFSEKLLSNEIIKTNKKIYNLEQDLNTHQHNLKFKEIADDIYASGVDLTKNATSFNNQPLNYQITLNENAQAFYALYKKAKAGIKVINLEIEKAKDNLEILKNLKETLEYIDDEDLNDFNQLLNEHGLKVKKQHRSKKPSINILKINFENATIYIGKNSKQNEYLMSKIANNDDLWLHVKGGTGSHVIVKGKITPNILNKAAMYAAFYSSYKHSNQIPIDYTLKRYVTKVRKSATFKVTYTNHKTIYLDQINQKLLNLL